MTESEVRRKLNLPELEGGEQIERGMTALQQTGVANA